MRKHLVIIGAGVAGGAAATTLRQEGCDDHITLIGAEPHPPYERPPLSKKYLTQSKELEDFLLQPRNFYQANEIDLRLGEKVIRIDPSLGCIEMSNNQQLPYDDLLIATGGQNRTLKLPGIELDGVVHLRTVDEAANIRERSRQASKAVVVGMGFIGCEVAASLRSTGLDVTGIEVFTTPLYAAVGEEVGSVIGDIHRDAGVDLICEDQVVAIKGKGKAEEVVTREGKVIECDLVVIGAGIEPSTDIAVDCGIHVDNGILVNEYCETNIPHIFAAGDVANHFHPLIGRTIRVEHFQNAVRQGAAAARSIWGRREPYQEIPWFWSDQFEHKIQQLGFHGSYDSVILRGEIDARRLAAFYLREGIVQSVVTINMAREIRKTAKLIREQQTVPPGVLEDEEVDLALLDYTRGA